MRNWILKLTFIGLLGFLGSFSAQAQVVRERPNHDMRREVRPARPSGRHYWREGEWGWNNGAYTWVGGAWVQPEHGTRWRKGHWGHERGGYRWHNGGWR